MVTFKVGDITLGTGVAGWCLNPIEITGATDLLEYEPTNVARFIQTLDDDGDTSNGILIVEAVHTAATGRSLNFNMHPDAFTDDANTQQVIAALTAVTSARTRPLIDTATARAHFRRTMLRMLSGVFEGEFDGARDDVAWTGLWEMSVAQDGTITGVFDPDHGDPIDFAGNMQPNATFACNDQSGGSGLWFSGVLRRDERGVPRPEGSWNDYFMGSGTFEGTWKLYPMTVPCD